MACDIRWLGTACFEIRLSNGKTIVIDPYLDDSASAPIGSEQVEGADFIFLTHGHYDHVLDVGKLVGRFNSAVYGSREACQSLAQWQNIDPARLHPITVGDRVQGPGFEAAVVKGVHVDFTEQYHRLTGGDILKDFGNDIETALQKGLEAAFGPVKLPDEFHAWMTRYPGGEQLNFIFDLGGGYRIYMAGSCPDPGLIETAEKSKASIMLIQVLPGKTLRGLEEATARFALASGAKIIVPQHHDPLFKGAAPTDLTKFRELMDAEGVRLLELTPGRWYPMPSTR
jgi:L-ascorbate metabolism protein UlaG (beta-lactamase superfamily)